ncbi:hypothetical protein [Kordia sp.]|uniref:hypothetical protein n=1 Tax=Kordia sp. TaxID=1965332 RepID=UPI0025C0CC87|nr:hypothetical protein [Kordia sp.]MCH2196941.1 hypothetical protein [Kordia sp.]
MRKIISYIILGFAIVMFIYAFINTGSFKTSLTIAGIALAWFLIENIFELLSLFGAKKDKKLNNESYKKDKEALQKVTDNNPTLR